MVRWCPRTCGGRPGRALVLARMLAAMLVKTVALLVEQVWGRTRPMGPAHAQIRAASELKGFQVFVKTLSGQSIAIHVQDGTVASLERLVSAREGISPADQRLTYAGRDLGDGALLLSECGIPKNATLHLSLRLRGGVPWGRLLMCVQAFQMVWPTVREFFRACWNACAKPENQCPPRCIKLCPDPEEEESEDEEPPEPESGFAVRKGVTIETWSELKPDMGIWLQQHSADVESGKIVEPAKTAEEHRHGRSLFNGNQKVWEIDKQP